jgi:hypothetical protein
MRQRYEEFVAALRVKYGIPLTLSAESLKFNSYLTDEEWEQLVKYQRALNIG